MLKDPEKRAAYYDPPRREAGSRARASRRRPAGTRASSSPAGGAAPAATPARLATSQSLFGAARAAAMLMAGASRVRRVPPGAASDATFARVEVSLEEAYHAAASTRSRCWPPTRRDGARTRQRTLDVARPAGAHRGQQHPPAPARAAERMGQACGRAPSTSRSRCRPHPLFRAEGRDVRLDVPVAPWGGGAGRARCPRPSAARSRTAVRNPAGSGAAAMRLEGRGLPGSPAGDQYLHLQVGRAAAAQRRRARLYEQMREDGLGFRPARAAAPAGPHDAHAPSPARAEPARPGEPGLAGRASRVFDVPHADCTVIELVEVRRRRA
ncbi:MAG: hypothetical protein U5K43_00375 [Halofilum sp. (in: g-proteobacteria)]|nr:hypothetical protein [Halofilum sp. (in: g-proteobacteria)]